MEGTAMGRWVMLGLGCLLVAVVLAALAVWTAPRLASRGLPAAAAGEPGSPATASPELSLAPGKR